MKNFALIGVGGYIAPRHLKAIKETGNNLVAALDKNDSVGILDSYFPDADFFTEFERFERHLEKLKHLNHDKKVDYISICSPNYLHDAHVRFGLRMEADVICEKPLVINPWNVEALMEAERETGQTINTILQLRLHPAIQKIKKDIEESKDEVFDIDLTYVTSRGHWYPVSWKGDEKKSGGLVNNIGIHFFDMLSWIFGETQENIVHLYEERKAAGYLRLKKANVRWFLSLNKEDIPISSQKNTYRSIKINGEEIEFSDGFTDLHTQSYKDILSGNGFFPEDVLSSIQIVHDIRNFSPIGLKGDYHPFLKGKNNG